MGVFAKIKGAKSFQSGQYYEPGNYRVEVEVNKLQSSQVGDDIFFIGEHRIIESDNPKRKVGSVVTFIENMRGKFPDAALGRVNDYMYKCASSMAVAMGGEPPTEEEIDEKFAESVCSEENTLKGAVLDVYVFEAKKKTKPDEVVNRIRFSVPEDQAAQAAG